MRALASERCKLTCRLGSLFLQCCGLKRVKVKLDWNSNLLSVISYIEILPPKLWCFFFSSFFGNIYLISQLPTPRCGLGLVNKQCWAVSEVWSILSSGSGFGAFCLRRTLVQYCNMCALKPCQRIVTYCVLPFFLFSVLCFIETDDNCFSTLIFL